MARWNCPRCSPGAKTRPDECTAPPAPVPSVCPCRPLSLSLRSGGCQRAHDSSHILTRVLTVKDIRGTRSGIIDPFSHMSLQNSTFSPLPTSIFTRLSKTSHASESLSISKPCQGWLGSVRLSHFHLTRIARLCGHISMVQGSGLAWLVWQFWAA
jgi:hypothetical protein